METEDKAIKKMKNFCPTSIQFKVYTQIYFIYLLYFFLLVSTERRGRRSKEKGFSHFLTLSLPHQPYHKCYNIYFCFLLILTHALFTLFDFSLPYNLKADISHFTAILFIRFLLANLKRHSILLFLVTVAIYLSALSFFFFLNNNKSKWQISCWQNEHGKKRRMGIIERNDKYVRTTPTSTNNIIVSDSGGYSININ